MDQEKELGKKIEEIKELGKQNKNVDVAALMVSALQNQNANKVSSRTKLWAYFISLGFPPFGLLFALKFYFGSEDDARHVANVCVVLTVVSFIFFWLIIKMFLSTAGVSIDQVQQINIQDVQQLLQ